MPRTPDITESEMVNFITFDTHKYIKELEAAGFPEEQAEVLIKSMLAARYYEASQLSTREQVEELKNDINNLKSELSKFATKEQVEKLEKQFKHELRAEIAGVKYDILKWIIPMFLGIIGMMVSIFLKLSYGF